MFSLKTISLSWNSLKLNVCSINDKLKFENRNTWFVKSIAIRKKKRLKKFVRIETCNEFDTRIRKRFKYCYIYVITSFTKVYRYFLVEIVDKRFFYYECQYKSFEKVFYQLNRAKIRRDHIITKTFDKRFYYC